VIYGGSCQSHKAGETEMQNPSITTGTELVEFLIDWAERFPNETSKEIAFRQSTICHCCGKQKQIGQMESCLSG
jgi:hypothetical protein